MPAWRGWFVLSCRPTVRPWSTGYIRHTTLIAWRCITRVLEVLQGADNNLAKCPAVPQATCYRDEAEAAMHLRFGRGADTAA